ncbi:MAG: hypothetical protein WDN07_02565 [Actinomycetota bacterium]
MKKFSQGVRFAAVLVIVIVVVDLLFFRHHTAQRLIVNVGIVLVFVAFWRFFNRPKKRS